jgi:hypothetical protein
MGALFLAVLAGAPCGTRVETGRDLMAEHRVAEGRGALAAAAGTPDRDVGDVAVLEDRGDLVVRRNPFDLDAAAIRFAPNAAGGYDAARLALALDPPGDTIDLSGTSAREAPLPFAFPFFGRSYTSAFVHRDGFVSFGAADPAGGEPGLGRALSGPPRAAALFARLDPLRGGRVSVRSSADRAVFAWHEVPGASQVNRNSFAIALHPDGRVDLVFGTIETREAVVGVSPGAGALPAAADLSAGEPRGGSSALLERFSERERLDVVATARRFYAAHPDGWEQLVVYTGRPLNPLAGSLAFAVSVRNEVSGIGFEIHDDSADWGSAGALASVVYMDSVDAYLEVDGFEILGHETGHRWLARLLVRPSDGSSSGALLGRGDAHWSFFLDSDASVLEGNQIEETSDGRFATTDIVQRFSPLDQYAMGLRSAAEVPRFFHVALADDFLPPRTYKASSGPEVGVRFSGVRRDLSIEDVVAALGPREPPADRAPRLLRQAYVLVADAETPATPERIATLERIRSRFPAWYLRATDGRGQVETSLR